MTYSKDEDASLSGKTLRRRNFLLTAGLGIGGAVAAVAGVKAVAKAEPAVPAAAQPQDKGYQATEHVRNYYRTARV